MRVVDALGAAIRAAAAHNPEVQAVPSCILWTDRHGLWERAIRRLQDELPELLCLGDYAPEKRTGPAIWLRCALAGVLSDLAVPTDGTPIIYLPGVGRQDLRPVDACPEHLVALAEVQFRGAFWSRPDKSDWTPLALVRSDHFRLDSARDASTEAALQRALPYLFDESLEDLRGKRLDADFFNELVSGGDIERAALRWINDEQMFRAERDEDGWKAFVELSKSQLKVDPAKDGVLVAAAQLARHEGPWKAVWDRYREAPRRYRNIPARIAACHPPSDNIFWKTCDLGNEGWPQWNDGHEAAVRQQLATIENMPPHSAREKIKELEEFHGIRRTTVWADLGEAPLAQALEHLALLAEVSSKGLNAGGLDDLVAGYLDCGWKGDDAIVRALAVTKEADLSVVSAAIRAVYVPWAMESARHLQKLARSAGYPTELTPNHIHGSQGGHCVLFADGLRLDMARRVKDKLQERGYEVEESVRFAPLPTVTATGKPAATPVHHLLEGTEATVEFEPVVAATGQSLKGGAVLRQTLSDHGWVVLDAAEIGDGQGKAWAEAGSIDHVGHDQGWKMARQAEDMLAEIADRVMNLLGAGWNHVRIVTDHGWLMVPGGLPKIELSAALAEHKWGRCAFIKEGAHAEESLYSWYWNKERYVALADGIHCYKAGLEYAHGGLSLQECLLLDLTVTNKPKTSSVASVKYAGVAWSGMRCKVLLEGESSGTSLDIRLQAGDASSSVASSVRPAKEGIASVVVEDEDLKGHTAFLVLLGASGQIEAQVETMIGGGTD